MGGREEGRGRLQAGEDGVVYLPFLVASSSL